MKTYFTSFVDVIQQYALEKPQKLAFVFLGDGVNETGSYTYEGLNKRSQAIAASLQQAKIEDGSVMLLFSSELEFVTAFMGCLYAKLLAVPVQLPGLNKPFDNIERIVQDAGVKCILTSSKTYQYLQKNKEKREFLQKMPHIIVDEVGESSAKDWKPVSIAPEELAFIQYTSGSTNEPKGVMVSHGNLMDNIRIMANVYLEEKHGIEVDNVIVSWLPFYHDMGLVGNLLASSYGGAKCVLMPPLAFFQSPIRWLQAISKYKANLSGGPNFSYDLCFKNVSDEEIEYLDLSSWRVAYNGAEPVRVASMRQFADRFAAAGFSHTSFLPCYGMAENTLFVASQHGIPETVVVNGSIFDSENRIERSNSESDQNREFVSCGLPYGKSNHSLAIVDQTSALELSEGHVGEIWICGDSVTQGYWKRPELTEQMFRAHLSGSGKGPYLRTGDLGFMLDGKLFVTGRLKDMIIIRGKNLYPNDIESSVEKSHEAIQLSGVAAFSTEIDGGEGIGLAIEIKRTFIKELDPDEVYLSVRKAIRKYYEVDVSAILLVRPLTLPKTSSGKIRRFAVRQAFRDDTLKVLHRASGLEQHSEQESDSDRIDESATVNSHTQNTLSKDIAHFLADKIAKANNLKIDEVDKNGPLDQYGLDSIAAVKISNELSLWLGKEVSPTIAYDFPAISKIASHLANEVKDAHLVTSQTINVNDEEPIAIIGMHNRFPGADDPVAYRNLLFEGKHAIKEVFPGRWYSRGTKAWLDSQGDDSIVLKGGFLEDIDKFDAEFFGISPREAKHLDPQQRLILEECWKALEQGGISPKSLSQGIVGVYVGVSNNDYAGFQQENGDELEPYAGTGNALGMIANRLSYFLDLKGPSISVDTACSSSLVAIHQACQSLRSGEINMAISAGVNVILNPRLTAIFDRSGMLANDALCKTLDASADGYVRGEGCGVVILKRLSDAKRDGDVIQAVIKGSALNQDGRSNGLTAPNGPSQQSVITEALHKAKTNISDVGYFEIHGSGTPLGDPIEVNSLVSLLKKEKGNLGKNRRWIGTAKTNIGHLESAAGIAGLIKSVLVLQQQEIPPHINFEKLNPNILLDEVPIAIPQERVPWQDTQGKRMAGISSFGFGGTNAHVILEEADSHPSTSKGPTRPMHLLTLSAKDNNGLKQQAENYLRFLDQNDGISLADLAYTANVGRAHFPHRLALRFDKKADLLEGLKDFTSGTSSSHWQASGIPARSQSKVAFLFTGQGSQYPGMCRDLYEGQPVFRQAMDQCAQLLEGELDIPLLEVLYGSENTYIDQTGYAQPAIFSVGYSLAILWRSWGVEPSVLIGHSIGEYTAACIAGVMGLSTALRLVAARGRLMQSLPSGGKMYAVMTTEGRVLKDLSGHEDKVSIAAINSPTNVVVSGAGEVLDTLVSGWSSEGITVQALNVSHAFHSPLMAEVLPKFRDLCSKESFGPGNEGMEVISTVTGKPVTNEMSDPAYWEGNIISPVLYHQGLTEVLSTSCTAHIEMGGHPVLTTMGRGIAGKDGGLWLPSVRRKRSDWEVLLSSLSSLYTNGAEVDWQGFDQAYSVKRIAGLPTYPFQRKSHWVYPIDNQSQQPIGGGFYDIQWFPQQQEKRNTVEADKWLVFTDEGVLSQKILAKLQTDSNAELIKVSRGDQYQELSKNEYIINPSSKADFQELSESILKGKAALGYKILYLWAYDNPFQEKSSAKQVLDNQVETTVSLLHLIQSPLMDERMVKGFYVVTHLAQKLSDQVTISLPQAAVWGLMKSFILEHGEFNTVLIDNTNTFSEEDIDHIYEELTTDTQENLIAFNQGSRYVARLINQSLEKAHTKVILDPEVSYLITGGYSALGKQITRWIIERNGKQIFWLGRKGLTPSLKQEIHELEKLGATIKVLKGDVAKHKVLHKHVEDIQKSGYPLKGIFHAAGVLDDGILLKQDRKKFEQVMQSKVAGAWNLHLVSEKLNLDHLVFFSSAAALIGSPGQANYSAANAFLIGMSHYRKSLGLPCHSISWGPWEGEGMAAKMNLKVSTNGLKKIKPRQAFEALDDFLFTERAHIGFMPIDKNAISKSFKSWPFLTHLVGSEINKPNKKESNSILLSKINEAKETEKLSIIEDYITTKVQHVLGLDAGNLDRERGFAEMGLDSMMVIELKNTIQTDLQIEVSTNALFNYANVKELSQYLLEQFSKDEASSISNDDTSVKQKANHSDDSPIAIVGVGLRFPGGCNDLNSFWELLSKGEHAIQEVPIQRWDIDQYFSPYPGVKSKMYARHGGFLSGVDGFDPDFFGISPREAMSLDPQQRMLLEVSWEALENAGLVSSIHKDTTTGIFIGIGQNEYAQSLAQQGDEHIDVYAGTGNGTCFSAGRISHILGTKGPSIAIDTACSSSLVSTHLACQSLRHGECDVALSGGVQLIISPNTQIFLSQAKALSPTGKCHTFSEEADGYVRGEGCGIIVLKRLKDAQEQGDSILGVIKGSAVNHDGKSSGLTVPNGKAQMEVIENALKNAGAKSSEISYVEAHGTGTPLGDPVEIEAIAKVMDAEEQRDRPLYVGSVKTNLGHLEAAAGIAGLIKVIAAFQNQQIPQHLNFTTPNTHINWDKLDIEIPQGLTPWQDTQSKRIAGISSFGLSGTNAHVILEEAEPLPSSHEGPNRPMHLLTLSAKDNNGLRQQAENYLRFLDQNDGISLADLAYTANVGRAHFPHRLALRFDKKADLLEGLKDFTSGASSSHWQASGIPARSQSKVAFLFTGQGSQYPGMCRDLYEGQPVFRQAMDQCAQLLEGELDIPLLEVLYGSENTYIDQTGYAQPAIFSVGYSLAILWRSWGVEPSVLIGHSIGEYTAACIAGVMGLSTALRLVAARGRLMQSLPSGGKMYAVMTTEDRVLKDLSGHEDKVSIAAINSPTNVVVSGAGEVLDTLVSGWSSEGITGQALNVSHAFHSPLMAEILPKFRDLCSKESFGPGNEGMEVISTVTGKPVTNEMSDPAYWEGNIISPVLYHQGLTEVLSTSCTAHIEMGGHPVLTTMGRGVAGKDGGLWLPSVRRKRSDWEVLLSSLSSLYTNGAEVDWQGFDRNYSRKKLTNLPAYPFQKQSYWVRYDGTTPAPKRKGKDELLLDLLQDGEKEKVLQEIETRSGRSEDQLKLFSEFIDILYSKTDEVKSESENLRYRYSWKLLPGMGQEGGNSELTNKSWLFVTTKEHLKDIQTGFLPYLNEENCYWVTPGNEFAKRDEKHWEVDPTNQESLESMLEDLPLRDNLNVVYLWGWQKTEESVYDLGLINDQQTLMGVGMINLVLALNRYRDNINSKVWVLTQGAMSVDNNQVINPLPALLWGMGKSVGIECPDLWGGMIDFDEDLSGQILETLTDAMFLAEEYSEKQLASRNGDLFAARVSKESTKKMDVPLQLSENKSYWITGGLGNIGIQVAQMLHNRGARHIVLLGRSGRVSESAHQAIEKMGAGGTKISILKADVGNWEEMNSVFKENIGDQPIGGIFHAAGVMAYEPFETMSEEAFNNMLRPKVIGTWILHELTKELDVDYFVCFSSIAAAWGSKGQVHYAGANQFMDSFCSYRRNLGINASVIHWGFWQNDAMEKEQKMLAQTGIVPLLPQQAIKELEDILVSGTDGQIIVSVNWNKLKPLFEMVGGAKLFEEIELESQADGIESEHSHYFITELEKAPIKNRRERLALFVQKEVVKILKGDETKLPPLEKGFFEMGFDSLMALELKEKLEKELRCSLPNTALFDFPNIDTLVEYLLKDALGWNIESKEVVETATSQSIVVEEDVSMTELKLMLEKEIEKN